MSIASEIQRIQTAKDDIVRALGRRGIVIPSGSTLDEFAEVIDPISSGKTIDWMDNPDNYLSFKFATDGSVRWQNAKGDIQYSKNSGSTWTYFSGATVSCNAGDEIWFKGTLTGGCGDGDVERTSKFCTAGQFYVYGNVQSLCSFSNVLAEYHFANLFRECIGLNISPEKQLLLPATALTPSCYYDMFYNCTSLVTAPELPATTLAESCYAEMFRGCTNLTTAPELPATTLAESCYEGMFSECTSLTVAHDLPATTLADSCYAYMFSSCYSLATTPALPATTLAEGCYEDMFEYCVSLTAAPVLPATILERNCYRSMFQECRSLTTAPGLPATTIAEQCYSSMFERCTNLATAPVILPAMTLAYHCYYYMFAYCQSLETAPELPATTLAQGCYNGMFYNCSGLTSAPELPATTLAQSCYSSMFSGCTSLTIAPELPATTLADYCYNNMFAGCTSLTTAPELPATTLLEDCYAYMFQECSNLNYIKCLATDISVEGCTDSWVNGVASAGTFVKDASMNNWESSTNGIPTNWTVQSIGLGVTPQRVSLYESGGSRQIIVTSTDNPWTATTSGNWISLSQSTGSTGETTITVTLSSTSSTRQGNVVLTDGNKSVTLPIIQSNNIEPLTFEIVSDGDISFYYNDWHLEPLKYRKNDDPLTTLERWNSFNVTSGDVVTFFGNNNSYGYCYFQGSANFNVRGNIMSLIDEDNYVFLDTLESHTFNQLFQNTYVVSAENLKLPATTLAEECYSNMFYNCTNLTGAPSSIGTSATTLAYNCCRSMFSDCTSLVVAPELPATALAGYCYASMFYNCTGLTTAPILPATTLAQGCYEYMFQGCSSLTTAPDLPATTLVFECYQQMFYNCSNLNYIKCLATTLSGSYTGFWTYGVSSSGTFVKDASTSWERGVNAIPFNWTIQDAS